jgi:serine/threonine protein kinase
MLHTTLPGTAVRVRDYQPGEVVPGTVYKIMRLIGAGGMGTVYDVEDTTIGKRYVLKTLHPRLGAREDLARRIQNEARTLARLHHSNIVEVITAGVTADALKLPYYLMERLSGQSLRVVLEKKGRLDLSHAYHIGIDLLDALDHAHDKGVIHRDVKPDNIFLHRTNAGVTLTKLLDFGIVSVLDAASGETAGRFLGTLRYAAPEQLRGEKPTAKTDVYSAGLVLYEILAGRGPFDDEGDAHRIAAAHMNKFPPALSEFVPVPRELDVLLMAALAKNPDARPRDAFSFAASLRNLKRLSEDVRWRERTENRATASGIIDPESNTRLPEARSTSNRTDSSSPLAPTGSPKTTLVGMPTPTVVPSLAPTSPSGAATDDEKHGAAVTNTLAPDTLPTPRCDTEALVPMRSLSPSEARLGEASTAIQWPVERAPILSDEPQVRSLPVPSRRRGLRSMGLAAAGIAFVAMAVVAMRYVSGPRSPGAAGWHANAVVVGPPALPSVTDLADRAVQSPAFSALQPEVNAARADPDSGQPSPPVSGPSVAPSGGKPALPKAKSHSLRASTPTSTAAVTDRPGPGF